MSDGWGRVADRGELAVQVFTRRWLGEAADVLLPPGWAFLAKVQPDGGDEFDMAIESAASLAEYLAQMTPHRVRVNFAPGEEAEPLLELLDARRYDGALVQ